MNLNFIKAGKPELNICIYELVNKIENEDTWACFKRLKKTKSFVISLYKRTCKQNNLNIEDEIIQKISSSLDDPDPVPKMISRKKLQ